MNQRERERERERGGGAKAVNRFIQGLVEEVERVCSKQKQRGCIVDDLKKRKRWTLKSL